MLVKKGIKEYINTNPIKKHTSFFFFFFFFFCFLIIIIFFFFYLFIFCFFFIIPNKFDFHFMSHQVTDNSVQVSFIPGCHRLMPALATIPVSHVVDSSVTVRQNILAIIPIYNLGLVAA